MVVERRDIMMMTKETMEDCYEKKVREVEKIYNFAMYRSLMFLMIKQQR